jgi:hypothetical protein
VPLRERTGIGSIGLVALDVGAYVRRRQQPDLDSLRVEPARPVMRAATRLHHHQTHRTVGKPAFELRARETLLLDRAPIVIGDRQLEDGFRKIHSHNGQSSGSIHVGLLLVDC